MMMNSNNNNNNNNKMDNSSSSYYSCRKLPWASELIWFPMTILFACLNVITRPLGIVNEVSLLVQGGFFGFTFFPILFFLTILKLIEKVIIIIKIQIITNTILIKYIGIPFMIYYVVAILIFDKGHLDVISSNPQKPRNWLEEEANGFVNSATHYFFEDDVEEAEVVVPAVSSLSTKDQQYVFGVHPHGIHCTPLIQFSTIGSQFDQQFHGFVGNKLSGLAASILFKLPVIRELFIRNGYIDASRKVAANALHNSRSIYVCVGGEEESMLTTIGRDIIVLKNRKGFIRLALSYGAALVPVFGVGNTDLYQENYALQKRCGIALPIFHGKYFTPLPYKPKSFKVLIGKPILTPKPKIVGERPNEQLVDMYHTKYIKALQDLHSQHVKGSDIGNSVTHSDQKARKEVVWGYCTKESPRLFVR